MMTRPFIILLAGSLLATATAHAERRSKRDRDRDRDDEVETTKVAKRGIGGEDRRRAAKSIDEDDEQDDEETPRKRSKKKKGVANAPGETEPADSDGPEALATVGVKLDSVIEAAIRHAPNLARAKLERVAAKGEAGAARIEQAWRMRAKAEYSQYGIGGDVEVNLLDVVKDERIEGTLGLGRKLPTGGEVGLQVGFLRNTKEIAISKKLLEELGVNKAEDQPEPQEYSTSHQTTASLTFTQPLLRGLGSDVALAKERKADFAYTEATINAQIEAEKLVLEIVQAYWELAFAAHELDTRMDSFSLAKQQERQTKEEIHAGAAPTSAMNAVSYELAAREGAVLRAQTEFEAKSLELRRKAGLELETRTLAIRPGEPFVAGTEEFDTDEMLERSRKSNRRVVLLQMRKRNAGVDVDVAKNAMLPQLDVSVSAGVMGTGLSSDAAFQNATGAAGYQVMASLNFQWEISGAAKDAYKAAVARKQAVDIDRLEIQRQIDADVAKAAANVKTARVRVGLAETAIRVAEENVKAERAQFQAQRSTNFDVMKRQSELADANLERGRAIADYHIAVTNLQYLSGSLLEDFRVNVRPVQERN